MTPRFSRSHSTRVSLIPPNPSRGTTASPYTLVEFSTSFFRFAFSRTRIYDPACASAGIPARTSPPQVTPDFAMAAVTMSMAAVTPALVGANKSAFKGTRVAAVAPKKVAGGRATLQVRTPAMRPPAPSPSDGRPRATIARARTPPDARLDRNARASPASSSRRPRARAAAPDRATSRKTRAIAPIQGPARVACGRGYAPDRRAREPRRPRDSVGARRDTLRARRGERRARRTPVPARATRRTSARGARAARLDRLFIHSLPFGDAVALGPGAPNPGFLSHEPARRKSEKTFRVFSNIAVFFVKTVPVPTSNPAP